MALAFGLALACSSTSESGAKSTEDAGPAPAPALPDPTLLSTREGALRGAYDGETRVWKGIPFASPPTGALRWRPPAAAASWTGERAANDFRAPCTQLTGAGKLLGGEDCLYLSVWSPSAPGQDAGARPALPVLVWLHGGDNIVGAASDGYYDAKELAERAQAVVVTLDYRLGAFGFLAHPAFAKESEHHASGDYGLLDAIAALQWVARNIAQVGGDPARVLLLGQSAGASDTCALIASPLARGLFSRAMMMSLSCAPLSSDLVTSTSASAQHRLGCDGAGDVAACLRGKSAEEVARLPGASLTPSIDAADYYVTVDGWVLPDDPQTLIAQGRHNHVPMILGTTRDEYSTVIDLLVPESVVGDDAYRAKVESWVGEALAPRVLALYPLASYVDARAALAAIASDQLMHCPTRRVARGARGAQREEVYRYLFAHPPTTGAAAAYGAGHGLDIDYLFRSFVDFPPTEDDRAFADALIASVARFASSGSPDPPGAAPDAPSTWPGYDAASDPYVVLASSPSHAAGLHSTACDFWESVTP